MLISNFLFCASGDDEGRGTGDGNECEGEGYMGYCVGVVVVMKAMVAWV